MISLESIPLELIGEEYRARRRWGDRPSLAEFLPRFRGRSPEIEAFLLQIDDELKDESAGPSMPPESVPTALAPDLPTLSHRDILLKRLIGAGRMGKVYEAWEHGSGRAVAVKFPRKSLLSHPGVAQRFLDESRAIARLRHPNIVGIRGLGQAPGGSYFLVMDLVDGPDLAHLIGRGAIAPDQAIEWTMQACDAMAHAHEQGIVHCDLKPANLLIDGRGTIWVADFGLARSLLGAASWTAEIEGTAPFMAPEQVSRAWGPIDGRTDVYGLGAVFFTLVTGRPPILGSTLSEILDGVIAKTPVDAPSLLRAGLSAAADEFCRRCLAKAPEARYQSVGELRAALAGLRATGPRTTSGLSAGLE